MAPTHAQRQSLSCGPSAPVTCWVALWLTRSLGDAHARQPVAIVAMRCAHVLHREPRAAEQAPQLVGPVACKEPSNTRNIALFPALAVAFLQAYYQHTPRLQHAADFSQRGECLTLGHVQQ